MTPPIGTAAPCLAFAFLTFLLFPGHTWLQQDTQIYVPILEHLRDPTVLRNDLVVGQPHVSFTLYDEVARGLRAVTGLGFREVLAMQQIATRAFGFWGLMLLAEALGLAFGGALTVAAICSLGAAIAGPMVLTVEYEPTPRAFAVPLLVCAMGLAARGRYLGAGIAGAVAFLYHPPTAVPFWSVYALIVFHNRSALLALPDGRGSHRIAGADSSVFPARPIDTPLHDTPLRSMPLHTEPRPSGSARSASLIFLPLAVAVLILFIAARIQGETQSFLRTISPAQETLQRMRASYVWVSMWPWTTIAQHLLIFAVLLGAYARVRRHMSWELRVFLLGLPAIGLLSMPLSWLLLEHWKWALIPQIQPMRGLLFGTLAMQLLTAAAGVRAGRSLEAVAWFTAACLLPLQQARTIFAAGRVETPGIVELSAWARSHTPVDAVFHFADAGRGLQPGVFRATALRAVYVDWKGGGQVNYLPEFGEKWWPRWQQMQSKRYEGLDIQYVVLQKAHRLALSPVYENGRYVVYEALPHW